MTVSPMSAWPPREAARRAGPAASRHWRGRPGSAQRPAHLVRVGVGLVTARVWGRVMVRMRVRARVRARARARARARVTGDGARVVRLGREPQRADQADPAGEVPG